MDTQVIAHPFYTPILRAKAGEIEALAHLSPAARTGLLPLLDIPKPSTREKEPLSKYLCGKVMSVADAWGSDLPILVDLSRFPPTARVDGGVHPVTYVFRVAKQCRLQAIPVTGSLLARGPEADYLNSVSKISRNDSRGVALRFYQGEFVEPSRFQDVVRSTRRHLGIEPQDCDVILDLEALDRRGIGVENVEEIAEQVRTAVEGLRDSSYRNIAIVGCSVPESVGKKSDSEPCRSTRIELAVWKKLISDEEFRGLVLGDYAVLYAFQTDDSPPVRPPSRIRLSTSCEHVFYRGSPEMYRQLRQKVAQDGLIVGMPDCWGRRSIVGQGSGYTGVGNATNWVAWDTNLHIEGTIALVQQELIRVGRMARSEKKSPTFGMVLQEDIELSR